MLPNHARLKSFAQELAISLPQIRTRDELNKLKARLGHEYGLSHVPRTLELFCYLGRDSMKKYGAVMMSKPMRTLSGVAPLAVMCKPFPCPVQAQCTFCPGGPGSAYGDTPKSYPGGSPAHLRGQRNQYDSYLQTINRLEQYALLGQDFSKVEVIVMGGTFTTYPIRYRNEFIAGLFKAMNDFSDLFFSSGTFDFERFVDFFELPAQLDDLERTKRIHAKLLAMKGKDLDLEKEKKRNETAAVRCALLCIETRSDCCTKVHINDILRLAGTRVELGVQSLSDVVLTRVKRGHGNAENVLATAMLKDAYLKVGYHMMLGLPGSTAEQDIDMMKRLFVDGNYQPDALKIYPCMVFKGTELYEDWKKGLFQPIDAYEAARRIVEIKQSIPPHCRVMRVQRDIPTTLVDAGVETTNLRQVIQETMKKKGVRCRCIRCREPRDAAVDWDCVKLQRFDYDASGGREIFLSYDDVKHDYLLGFVRLRIPGDHVYRPEIQDATAGIREIHVYGRAIPVGSEEQDVQHRGLGVQLMGEAEKIAREEFDRTKMVVIAGVGVKEWFRKKLGYADDGAYVSKRL